MILNKKKRIKSSECLCYNDLDDHDHDEDDDDNGPSVSVFVLN